MRVFTSEWQGTYTDISPSKILDEKTALRGKTKAPVALILCKASTPNESIYPGCFGFWLIQVFCSQNTIFSIRSGCNCLVRSQNTYEQLMYNVEYFSSIQNEFLMPQKTALTGPYEAIIQCILLVNTVFDTIALFISQ